MKQNDNPNKTQEAQNTLLRFDLDKSYVPWSKIAANLIKIQWKNQFWLYKAMKISSCTQNQGIFAYH